LVEAWRRLTTGAAQQKECMVHLGSIRLTIVPFKMIPITCEIKRRNDFIALRAQEIRIGFSKRQTEKTFSRHQTPQVLRVVLRKSYLP
jgi:hypothetical protein